MLKVSDNAEVWYEYLVSTLNSLCWDARSYGHDDYGLEDFGVSMWGAEVEDEGAEVYHPEAVAYARKIIQDLGL